jgi:hypothetical protein
MLRGMERHEFLVPFLPRMLLSTDSYQPSRGSCLEFDSYLSRDEFGATL